MASLRREPMACRNVSRPSGVRVISTCGAPAAAFSFSSGSASSLLLRRRRRGPVQHVHRGLVGGQHVLGGQRSEHRLAEPGLPGLRRHPGSGLTGPPGGNRDAGQHAHDLRGPLRWHVPVTRQQHRRGVQHRPIGHRAPMRARRRLRERDRPAARAQKTRQQPFGHLPDDLRVDDLRPPRLHRIRAVQARLDVRGAARAPARLQQSVCRQCPGAGNLGAATTLCVPRIASTPLTSRVARPVLCP